MTGLSNAVAYTFKLRAVNRVGEGAETGEASATPQANARPVVTGENVAVDEDTAVTIDVLANDSDPEGDPRSVESVTDPAYGTAEVNADNTVTYTPNPDYAGPDSFTYEVSDGLGATVTGTVTVTVRPLPDDPVAVDDTESLNEDASVTIAVLANDSDPDEGAVLSVRSAAKPKTGSATVNADNTVTYEPNADFNGEDSFTYTVVDDTGRTATATVRVSVAAVDDDPPVATDYSVRTNENEAVVIDVLANDRDPDGQTLTVAITSQPGEGTAVRNADDTITYTPATDFLGVESFEYRVTDPTGRSATATVTVEVARNVEERVARVNETVVPEVTRAMTASTLSAVTGRIEAVASGAAPATTVNIAGSSTLHHALKANARAIKEGTLDLQRVLAGSSFTLPLSAVGDGAAGPLSRLAFWGSGDYRNLSGGDTSAVEWEGEVWSAHLGADARLSDEALAGLSLSLSEGTFDYTDHTDGEAMSGDTETRMTSLNPYIGWSTPNGIDLWGTVGYGWGELKITDDAADAPETSDLTQTSFAVGGGWRVFSSDALIEGGATALKAKAQISAARIEVEGAGLIEPMTVEVSQGRVALEASHAHALAAGGTLTPAIELGLRQDAGDGETGTGVELGGSLRYQDPATGLTVQGHGRALLTHSGNYEEWGFGGLIRLDPGSDRRGLALSLVPGWGETQSGTQRLWNDGVNDRAANDYEAQARLQAEFGYGFGVFGGTGVLTPYSGRSLAGEGAGRYTLGSRLEIGSSLNLSLEGERREAANDEADHGIMLRGQLRS